MRYLISGLLLLALFSCKKESNDWTRPATLMNLAYGQDRQQKLDLYLPENRSPDRTPLLILINGTNWFAGDKKDLIPFIDALKKRFPDYAFANLNYRLHKLGSNITNGINPFPSQEQDIAKAIKLLSDQSGIYGYSNTNVAILGTSAGGHLALLQAYKNTGAVQPKAVISLYGPTELVSHYNNYASDLPVQNVLASLARSTTATSLQPFRINSPFEYLRPGASPTLLFHGLQDQVVHVSQSELLYKRCLELAVPAEFYVYPNEGHGWTGPALDDTFNKTEAFLRKYIR